MQIHFCIDPTFKSNTTTGKREWFARGTQQPLELELCDDHLGPPSHALSQQLQEIPLPKISPLRSTGIRPKQQTETLQYWKSGWLKNAVNKQISYILSNSFSPTCENFSLRFKTIHTLIRYHKVRPVILNVILLRWVLYAKFLSLLSWATFFFVSEGKTHCCFSFFFYFKSFLSMSFQLDTEDTGDLQTVYLNLFCSISYSDPWRFSTFDWQCLVWTIRKGDCEVHFVLLASLEERWAHLKDELHKAQVRSKIHHTNCTQVWLGLCGGHQREPRVPKYTQKVHI